MTSSLGASSTNTKSAFSAVLQLVNDPSTASHYERHRAQLDTIIDGYRNGWPAAVAVDGLPQVLSFIVTAMNRDPVAAARSLEPPLVRILALCAKPLLCTTLYDQRIHLEALKSVMESVAGTLMVPSPSPVRAQALTVLRDIFRVIRSQCGDDVSDANLDTKAVVQRRKDWYMAITEKTVKHLIDLWAAAVADEASTVMRTVVEQIRSPHKNASRSSGADSDGEDMGASEIAADGNTLNHQPSAEVTNVCKVLLELTHYRRTTTMLLQANAPDLLLQTLRQCGAGDRRTPICVEMCWNALSLAREDWSYKLGSREFLETLFSVLQLTLSVGHKLKERELRNDILVLLGLIADDKDAAKRVTTDMITLVLCLSCGAERNAPHDAVNPKYHHTTSHNEDLQLKKLCWHLLAKLARDPTLASFIFNWGFFDVLLMYLNVRCEAPCIVAWSTLQLFDLQSVILTILIDLIAVGAAHFSRCSGPQILREYTSECPRHDLRNSAVALFARGAQTQIRKDFVSVGCVAMALALLRDTADIDVRIDCLNMLADAVDRDPDLQSQFGHFDGIGTVLPFLTPKLTHFTDRLDALVFAAVDCLWSCAFGCPDNERALVELGGIASLLSVVESSSPWMLPLPLSCLSDILQNGAAVQDARLWRSPSSGKSAVQVLLAVQQKNDAARPRPSHMHSISRRALHDPPTDVSSLAESRAMHFKVFSALCVIGFDGHSELDASERALLACVEQFVATCKDDIWAEVESSLAEANVRPITPDGATLRTLRREADLRSLKLRTTRKAFDEIHTRQREEAERTFYKSLIKKTDEKRVNASTGRPLGLSITEAKIRKAQMLKQSLKDEHTRALARATENDQQQDSARAHATAPVEPAPVAEVAPTEDRVERWGIGQRAMHETEYEVLEALNQVRTKPRSLIPHIQEKMKYFNETFSSIYVPGRDPETSEEGKAVYEEAISFLENVRPIVTLLDVPMGMLLAARDHTRDLSKQMKLSVNGSDNSTPLQRLQRYGECNAKYQQLIAHGESSALNIVMQLIVDDGVRSRVDRRTIFDPAIRVCGVSVGPNPIYGHVGVIMLATDYQDNDVEQQLEVHRSLPH